MKKEYKETLQQQLQLLSESSKKADPVELVELTDCMIRVQQELLAEDYMTTLNQRN
ncbi:hypothetical protein [Levilactobacillus brevis]|uniref:hypothetical protein n=1 Tax=Levilactobacillus brevis TaxID=1580 RepID=UPI000DFD1473|nr:hypothetical protein [Levilactobacillus brevis]UIF29174.1 hypothetical protein KB236_11815 [Levilactobacillus brevis]STX20419.1 Uncharacterised protein [Levilactobacillus brevis]